MEPIQSASELAKLLDLHLVSPGLTEDQVREGCYEAATQELAAVIVRPCDIEVAIRSTRGSTVAVGASIGFPHGTQNTSTKLFEARDLLRRGARELEVVLNPGKMRSRQFVYLETELAQIVQAAKAEDAIVKVIFENTALDFELKIIACRLTRKAEAHFGSTSTGFAGPPSRDDVKLMSEKLGFLAAVKVNGVQTLDDVLAYRELGAARFGTAKAFAILDAFRKQGAPATVIS
jgi:deoxyribose-phosphate aldolase